MTFGKSANEKIGKKRFKAQKSHEKVISRYQVCFLVTVGDREGVFSMKVKGEEGWKRREAKADWRYCKDGDIPM